MANEPVVTAASIAGVISALIVLARLMGWIDLTDDQFNQMMIVVGLVLPIGFSIWARSRVTPLSDPKDNEGRPLAARSG